MQWKIDFSPFYFDLWAVIKLVEKHRSPVLLYVKLYEIKCKQNVHYIK